MEDFPNIQKERKDDRALINALFKLQPCIRYKRSEACESKCVADHQPSMCSTVSQKMSTIFVYYHNSL